MSYGSKVRFADRSTPPHVFTLVLVASMTALTMNVFLPSLPAMAAHFNTEYRVIGLAVSLFLAVNAVLQIIVGPLSDWFGRRIVLIVSITIFLAATLGCIYAPTIESFLFFRMCQAVVATGMVLSRAIVRDVVPMNQAASMIGYVTMGMAVVPMIGPAIGGALDEMFGWQANFWLLFLLGVALFWLCWRDLGETAPLSGRTLAQQFRDYPALLTSRRFWGYALAAGLSSGSFFAYLGGAPFVGDRVFGLPPATLGILFGAPAIGYFTGNFVSGRFSTRIGVNRMVLWGAMSNASGIALNLLLFTLGLGTPLSFFGLMVFMGLGNGMVIPNATAGALSIRPDLAGTASGLSGALMIGIGAALSALAGLLLTPGSGAFALLGIMLCSGLAAIGTILLVIRRERRLGLS